MTAAGPLAGLANFRDVGGLRTQAGEVVPHGVLYRSEAPQPDDHAPADAVAWPPRTVIDLRADQEIPDPHPLAEVAAVHHLPMDVMLAPDAVSREHVDELDLIARYGLLLGSADHQMAELVEVVAQAEAPILVHCVAGKDRTGIVIGMLLRLIGVKSDVVLADYIRTNDNLPELLTRLRSAGLQIPSDPSLLAVSREALEGVLASMEGDTGSPVDWLRGKGVPADKLALARKRLTSG